jgi:1-acyl-sn-glycerol-3-phosphate acyltransferase
MAAPAPGPVIVLCRLLNIVDASLPTLLYQRLGYRTCGVIMAELLADRGFDLIYARTGSVFIPRGNGPGAIAMIRDIGENVDSASAVVIFLEGRLFRPDRLERVTARLAAENPERAARLASLGHVLPPRPGGVLALVDSVPRRRRGYLTPQTRPIRIVYRPRQSRPPPRPDPDHGMANPRRPDPNR